MLVKSFVGAFSVFGCFVLDFEDSLEMLDGSGEEKFVAFLGSFGRNAVLELEEVGSDGMEVLFLDVGCEKTSLIFATDHQVQDFEFMAE